MNKYKAEFTIRNGDKISIEFSDPKESAAVRTTWNYFQNLLGNSPLLDGLVGFILEKNGKNLRVIYFPNGISKKFIYECLFNKEFI